MHSNVDRWNRGGHSNGCPPMVELSEQQLAQAAAKGDQDALSGLLEVFQHRVYHVCLRMLGHREDAAEAAQDTLLRVVERIREFRGDSAVSTWIIRIAMTQSISLLRKRKVRKTTSLDAERRSDGGTSSIGQELTDSREQNPASSVEQDEMVGHLKQALDRVDEQFRAVLVLRDLEQMDYDGIAEVMSIPVGTVKSRLFRARLALRHELVRLCPPTPPAPPGKDMSGRQA